MDERGETLAERMHREGWRTRESSTYAHRDVGDQYRVTVTPADAPKPKPVGYAVRSDTGKWVTTGHGVQIFGSEDVAESYLGEVVPLYEHPPAPVEPRQDKPETLAERMHREEWRTMDGVRGNVSRIVGDGGWPQITQVPAWVWEAMRELENPPAPTVEQLQERIRELESDSERSENEIASREDVQRRLIEERDSAEARVAELEQQRGEPVGWRYRNGVCGWKLTDYGGKAEAMRRDGYEVQPVYASPPEPAEQDCPTCEDPADICEYYGCIAPAEQEPELQNIAMDRTQWCAACNAGPSMIGPKHTCGFNMLGVDFPAAQLPCHACAEEDEEGGKLLIEAAAHTCNMAQEPADDPATAEARELHEQGLLPMPEDRGCEAVGRVGRYVSKATYDAAVRLMKERDTDPELPSLPDARAGYDAGDEDDYDGKVL